MFHESDGPPQTQQEHEKEVLILPLPVNSASWCRLGKFRILKVCFCIIQGQHLTSLTCRWVLAYHERPLEAIHPFSPWMLVFYHVVAELQYTSEFIFVKQPFLLQLATNNVCQYVYSALLLFFFHIYMHFLFPKGSLNSTEKCLCIWLQKDPQQLNVRQVSSKSEWTKSQPFVAYKFLIFLWKAANIWLQIPGTITDLYLIYPLSVWTWAFTSACALYGERKGNRKYLPGTVDLHLQAFPNLFWNSCFFFLWQFISVSNSRSSH